MAPPFGAVSTHWGSLSCPEEGVGTRAPPAAPWEERVVMICAREMEAWWATCRDVDEASCSCAATPQVSLHPEEQDLGVRAQVHGPLGDRKALVLPGVLGTCWWVRIAHMLAPRSLSSS